MNQEKTSKALRNTITVLAILLCVSIVALAGVFIYGQAGNDGPTTDVPENLITSSEAPAASAQPSVPAWTPGASVAADAEETETPAPQRLSSHEVKKAAAIRLFNKQPDYNTAFSVSNMFPGDTQTKYYAVQVSYHDKITLHYHADIRPGSEKLAEVLKVRITSLNDNKTMYDGLMRDMAKSLTYKMSSDKSTTSEVYYGIEAYLDTSVGNEYQQKSLTADFRWWVEETGNLDPPPVTGDNTLSAVLAIAACICGVVLIIILILRRRKGEKQ